jgi:hypothetical protein
MSFGKLLCGLAAVAALLTVPASAAAFGPGDFLFSKYPNKAHAVQTTKHVLAITGSTMECSTINLDSATQSGPASELTLTPTYSGCTAFGFAATITTNGCTYRLAQPEGISDEWEGGFSIKCPEGKKIVIKVDNVFAKCTVEIGEQTPTGNVAYENDTANGEVDLAFSFTKLEDNVVTSSGNCPLVLGKHTNSTYSGASAAEAAEGGNVLIG